MRRSFANKMGTVCAAMAVHALAGAQGLPPIYDKTPAALLPATTLAEFPRQTFLENVAIGAGGSLFVNSYTDGKVLRVDSAGQASEWTVIDGTIAGIALNPDGSAVVSGWIKGKAPAVFTVSAAGRNEIAVRLPQGMFPNGVVRLGPDRYLVADSYRGLIWAVDLAARAASVWTEDEALSRADAANPTPAVNGLKVAGGFVYASNTARQLLVRIPLVDGGARAGTPEVWMRGIGLDDFDFDAQGNLYGTTHVYNSLVRVAPDRSVTVVAGLAQGMAGSTAVATDRTAGRPARLFVVTNGGLSLPPEGGVQTAKIVRIDLPAAR